RDRIEPGQRLVVEHQRRVERDRARQRHAPRHAAGELARVQVHGGAQAHRVQPHAHQPGDHPGRPPRVRAPGPGPVLCGGEVGQQAVALQQHADALAQLQQLALAPRHRLAEHLHAARGRLQLSRQRGQQRGLAAARGPEDGGDAAARDLQVHARQDRARAAVQAHAGKADGGDVRCGVRSVGHGPGRVRGAEPRKDRAGRLNARGAAGGKHYRRCGRRGPVSHAATALRHDGRMPQGTHGDFRLYHSNALDVLAGILADLLRAPVAPERLLEPEVVLIPQVAMRRWLQATLAAAHGVAANIDFLTPGEFVGRALAANLGPAQGELDADTLHWRLYAALREPALLEQPALAAIAAHVGGGDPLRAWALAGELAAVFEKYQAWRRDWLLRWE